MGQQCNPFLRVKLNQSLRELRPLWVAVPRRQAGDRRAYERVETEPGLDHYIKDSKGRVLPCRFAD